MLVDRLILIALLSIAVVAPIDAIDDQCLACICEKESGCRPLPCKWDKGSDSCGYYQLKHVYWKDCGSPGVTLEDCAMNKQCSERCIRAYMKRYAARCVGHRVPTCEDYARIHNGGPTGCERSSTVGYGRAVARCYANA